MSLRMASSAWEKSPTIPTTRPAAAVPARVCRLVVYPIGSPYSVGVGCTNWPSGGRVHLRGRLGRLPGVPEVLAGVVGEDDPGRRVPVALDGPIAADTAKATRSAVVAELGRLRRLRQLGVEGADDGAGGGPAEGVGVDVVGERGPDVLVDQDRRVVLGVLDQLLGVHDDRRGLDDVEGDFGVLGAGRRLVGTFRHGRDGRTADVLGELFALAADTADAEAGHAT